MKKMNFRKDSPNSEGIGSPLKSSSEKFDIGENLI